METLILERDDTGDTGTFGMLLRAGKFIAHTCELPWLSNQNRISCIPKGTYNVTKFQSPSKGSVFLLHGVPGRDMIEIHAGNTMRDVLGCIAVGDMRGSLKMADDRIMPAVLHSKLTLQTLLNNLPDSFMLEVSGACG